MSLNIHKKIKVLLVGGGTGGHIYPGVALAKELIARENIECMMVITSKTTDKQILESECIPYKMLPIKGMNWEFSIKMIADLYRFVLSFLRAWQIISSYTPDMIIGLGAYVSFPVISLGRIKGITTFIHEQNLMPGKANLILGKWVDGSDLMAIPYYARSNRFKEAGRPPRGRGPLISSVWLKDQ